MRAIAAFAAVVAQNIFRAPIRQSSCWSRVEISACWAATNGLPGGHYSTLAGFVEPGETIEEAVAREIFEEVGLRAQRIRYFASQPWPFPANLMIGCFAEVNSGNITVDGQEIVAARWFDHAEIQRLISGASTEVGLPRRDAIAFQLIAHWAENRPWT